MADDMFQKRRMCVCQFHDLGTDGACVILGIDRLDAVFLVAAQAVHRLLNNMIRCTWATISADSDIAAGPRAHLAWLSIMQQFVVF